MHSKITSKRSKCCRSCSNLEIIDECKMCRIRKYIYIVSLSGHLKYRYADIEMSDKYIKFYNHPYNIFSVSYNCRTINLFSNIHGLMYLFRLYTKTEDVDRREEGSICHLEYLLGCRLLQHMNHLLYSNYSTN